MRAEAVSWDDWTAVNVAPVVDEDKWHVALAPGEVKVVSLEQLDDLFRLSIVDAETKVWQNGMSDWQPLRVIADLDDAPAAAPEPKRTHPKPPSPRSLPPQARPQSAAPQSPSERPPAPQPRPQSVAPPSPSVRPAPPPARPQSVAPPSPSVRPPAPQPRPQSVAPAPSPSVRPPAPQPRPQSVAPAPSPSVRPPAPQPRPQSVAPAPAYGNAFGLAATQPAFPAPVSAQPVPSVRPLVVSAMPPAPQGAGAFGRFLIGLSLAAGLSLVLYRNGILRDAALSTHQDALFAKLESALGGPAFGTLAAIEQPTMSRGGLSLTSDLSASLAAAVPALAARSEPTPAEAAPQGAEPKALTGAATTPVVSLQSLDRENPNTNRQKLEKPVAEKAAPTASPKRAAQPHDEAASPKAASKPAFEKQSKPAAEMTERERLNAAIGQSMSTTKPTKSKSKASRSSEYDPLNPNL